MRALSLAAVLSLAPAAGLLAQEPVPVQPSPQDTIKVEPFRFRPPISPLGALWRSMAVPGWGQMVLGRRVTGAVFVFWEGVTLTMTLKAIHQKNYLERIESGSVDEKGQEVQDWAVLLAFNHLFAGAEAFVSAQFWDFPGDLQLQAMPGGGFGLAASIPFR